MSPTDLALAAAAFALGSTVQGAVGFGQALVAVPLLLLIDPDLVPGPATIAGLTLNALMLTRDHGHADHTGLAWALGGVVPGTVLAAIALAVISSQALAVTSAVLILAAVAVSASGLHPRPRPSTLFGAGTASGFMGTTAAVSGPPVALLYQASTGPALRATLARFFLMSGLLTLIALVPAGKLGAPEVRWGLAMVPGAALGFVLSGPLRRHVDAGRTRGAVLWIAGLSGTAALCKALL